MKIKSVSLLILVLGVLVLSSCVGNGADKDLPNSDSQVVIESAQVAEFLTFSQPRRIIFAEVVNGDTQNWFDETPEGDGYINNTLVFSRNGCALAGLPYKLAIPSGSAVNQSMKIPCWQRRSGF